MNLSNNTIIAIDGFSSCGKSTIAKDLAKKLNFTYIDSGAMYRAVTLLALRNDLIDGVNISLHNLLQELDKIRLEFRFNSEKDRQEIYLNGENVEDEIRDIEVSDAVSIISKQKDVRKVMVDLQRKMQDSSGIVMDGRDIGTVVFPNADLKIFMTASEEIRAQRRYLELMEKNMDVSYDEIRKNIAYRDFIDQNRDESPLRKAEDAYELDNTHLTRQEQLDWILNIYTQKVLKSNS